MLTAASKRQRLLPPLQLAGFGVLLLLLLFLVFPRDSLQNRLLGNEQADVLAVAYLEAWQRVEPHNIDVLTTLSREYLKGNRPDDAARLLARLRESADPLARQNALLIEIGIAQSEMFAATRPELKQQRKSDLLALLTQAVPLPWNLRQLQALAEAANLSGALALSGRFYSLLARADSARAFYWYGKSAQLYIGQLEFREAAQAYFAAQAQAHSRIDQRRSFIAALSVLQMGNLLPEAINAASAHIGPLANDTVSLRFLARLALAAGRPDLAAIYVARLLQSEPELMTPSSGAGARAALGGGGALPVAWSLPLPRRTVLVDPALYMPGVATRAGLLRVSESRPVTAVVAPSPAAQDLDLAYQIYLANGNLAQAEKIAQQALALHLDARVWRARLAQVAQWNQDPATALAQSMILSRDSQDEKLWQQIARLALALNDSSAQLAVSLHESQREPANMALLDQVVASYEAQGEPELAARYLATRLQSAARRQVLERYAALALRMGHDDLALASYRALVSEPHPNPDDALQLALILFKRSQFQPALAALSSAQGEADARHQDFWRFYAQLARLLQQSESVSLANRQLVAGGVSDDDTLQQMIGSVYASPLETARLAGYAYQQNGKPQNLVLALNGYLRAHDLARASSLLQSLTPRQRADAQLNAGFLLARADYSTQSGQAGAGLQDLQLALRLAPTQSDARAAYLWFLIDQGDDGALRAALKQYAATADNDPGLIGAYAAGYLHLGQARLALHYFHLDHTGRGRDPLWLLSYADALEANQRAGDAWRVRRLVWLHLLPQSLQETKDLDLRHELSASHIGLSDSFVGGDRARAELAQALGQERREGGETSTAAPSLAWRNAALAWAQSHDAYPLEKAWLARQYLNWLSAPASVQFSLALAQNDQPALRALLAQKAGQVPAETRADALSALDLPDQALSELFAAQSTQPDNEGLNATLREHLLAAAQTLSFGWKDVKQGSLQYQESSLSAGIGLAANQSLTLLFDQRNQQADPSQLPQTPGEDHTLALQYRHFAQDDSEKLTLGQRQAWTHLTPLLLEGSWLDSRPLSFHYSLGSEQPASESPQLMIAGMKNLAGVGANWRINSNWFAASALEYDRYYLQDREFLGEGYSANVDAGYKFKTDYPDYTLRATYSHGQYSAYGNPQLGLSELLPPGAVGGASAVMPQTLSQSGLLFSFGTDLPEGYSHDWRPYLEAGPIYDTHAHWGASVNLGMVGSVMGGDRMEVFYQHEDMSAQTSSPVTEYGLRYSWFF